MNAHAHAPVYTADEFDREARRIETLVWEALVVEPEMRVLICGYGPDGGLVRRACAIGAHVTVIEHRDDVIRRFASLGATLMRGSTSVIPAKERSFDLAVASHYLHEVDPFFHAQVVSELARVARRVAIVEPAPPTDPLGKRIALLYSQAKRELGQFEYYQPLEYWKKLLQSTKAEISQHVFAFAKVPPREYLVDTIALLLATMRVEDIPQNYLEELRAIVARSDALLLPQPRYILVGAPVGELPIPQFSAREEPPALVTATAPIPSVREVTAAAGYEFPPVEPTATPAAPVTPSVPPPSAPPASFPGSSPQPNWAAHLEPPPTFVPGLPFGAPPPPSTEHSVPPFGMPFAVPPHDADAPATPAAVSPFGWEWEPPEDPNSPP
ncbi:MAG: class I SAM-dependent methyltransferase [Vulcanimicrobiaceae bacterium]